MADLCASVVVVLGTAWVVRWVMDWPDRQPLTPVRRRRWVFLSLLLSVAVHAVLAGFALISWRSTAISVTLVGIWLVLCRLMVRSGRDTRYTSPPAPGGWQPAVLRRLSPATLALTLAAILTLWVALNPLGDDRNTAVAATGSARTAPASSTPEAVQIGPVLPITAPSRSATTDQADPAGGTAARVVPRSASATASSTVTTRGPVTSSDRSDRKQAIAMLPAARAGGVVLASRGAIIYVGDNGHLTANTAPTSSSGAVALGVTRSDLRSGRSRGTTSGLQDTAARAADPRRTAARAAGDLGTAARATARQGAGARSTRKPVSAANGTITALGKHGTGPRGTSLSGFEDHSVAVDGDDQVVTYDDSNVFINRQGLINANTGDTDSSGLNAVDVAGSTVRAGNSGDGEGDGESAEEEALSPATSNDDERVALVNGTASRTGAPASTTGRAFGTVTDEGASNAHGKSAFVVGADGVDDVSIRSHGRHDIVSYDDSNVTIGGSGKVNAQIGDSDTGGGVVMGIRNSDVRAGCEGDLCYSKNSPGSLVAQLLGSSGLRLRPAQWRQLVEFVTQQYASEQPLHHRH